MHLNSCTLLSAAQPISLAGLQMMHTETPHTLCGIYMHVYILHVQEKNVCCAGGGGGGSFTSLTARPYDLIAEGVKVECSSIVIS